MTYRTQLLPTILFCAAAIAAGPSAHGSADLPDAIGACRSVADDAARLACYDRAVTVSDATTPAPDSLQKREEDLSQREESLKIREAALVAQQKSVEDSASLFGINIGSVGPDRLTKAANGLPAERVERDEKGAVEAITASVREWSYSPRGQITLVLDNGQVWSQTDTTQAYLSTNTKVPHRVRIFRGSMSSFLMTIDGKNKTYKIRRVDGGIRQ